MLEDFVQWLLCTNSGLAAKVCLDAGAALMKGASGRVVLASLLGI